MKLSGEYEETGTTLLEPTSPVLKQKQTFLTFLKAIPPSTAYIVQLAISSAGRMRTRSTGLCDTG
jgi:hypothetical protein